MERIVYRCIYEFAIKDESLFVSAYLYVFCLAPLQPQLKFFFVN